MNFLAKILPLNIIHIRKSGEKAMLKICLFWGLTLLAASASACAQKSPLKDDAPATPTAAIRTFEKTDDGKSVRLKIGEEFQIQLKGVPTAGYTWKIMEMDTARLRLISEDQKSLTPVGMVGGSSLFIWRLSPQTAGKSRLVLKNFRSWEGADKAVETFTLIIHAEKN